MSNANSEDKHFLRLDIQAEPLFDQWYAWPHLISPATAARNLSERHVKIMESYVNAPQIHANAVRNPKMRGGPFIDYDGKRVEDIKALLDRTRKVRAPLIELSKALEDLNGLLQKSATGFSVHPLYSDVPALLRGYVELTYDLNNNSGYRLIEPLLYRSRFYDESAQTVMMSVTKGDNRPFVLSTPRLKDEQSIHIRIPFRDERWDLLFAAKTRPTSLRDIREAFAIPREAEDLFESFFTTVPPATYERFRGAGLRCRYFGHACVLVETPDVSILTDPVLSYTHDFSIPRYTYTDLPESIDYVVITHNHQDHVLLETLLQLRHRIKQIVVPRNGSGTLQDPSLRLMLNEIGFQNIVELSEFDKIEVPNGFIMGLPFLGEHSDLAIGAKLAHFVRLGTYGMLFAADSCNIEPRLYEHIHAAVGSIDSLFLGMECDGAPLSWLYGPLISRRLERSMDESRRLNGSNFEQAISIVRQFKCREVYVYAMGQEPWMNFVSSLKYTPESRPIVESDKLVAECQKLGILAERLYGQKEILMEESALT